MSIHDFSDWPRVQGHSVEDARKLLDIERSITTNRDYQEWSGSSVLVFPRELCDTDEPRTVVAQWTIASGMVLFNLSRVVGDDAFWGRIAEAGGLHDVWPEFDRELQRARRSSNPRRALERLRQDPWRFAQEVA